MEISSWYKLFEDSKLQGQQIPHASKNYGRAPFCGNKMEFLSYTEDEQLGSPAVFEGLRFKSKIAVMKD